MMNAGFAARRVTGPTSAVRGETEVEMTDVGVAIVEDPLAAEATHVIADHPNLNATKAEETRVEENLEEVVVPEDLAAEAPTSSDATLAATADRVSVRTKCAKVAASCAKSVAISSVTVPTCAEMGEVIIEMAAALTIGDRLGETMEAGVTSEDAEARPVEVATTEIATIATKGEGLSHVIEDHLTMIADATMVEMIVNTRLQAEVVDLPLVRPTFRHPATTTNHLLPETEWIVSEHKALYATAGTNTGGTAYEA